MKFLLCTLSLCLMLAGCGDNKSNKNQMNIQGIPSAIIGNWEIDSIWINGQVTKADRPDLADPFKERNTEWYQLKIDQNTLSLIITDFITYLELPSRYQVDGVMIRTTDSKDSTLTDFKVHSYTQNTLTLEFVYENDSSSGVRYTFKRIDESHLAQKSAKSTQVEQSFALTYQDGSSADITVAKQAKGEIDVSSPGMKDVVSCTMTREKNLFVSTHSFELQVDSTAFYSSEFDRASFEFKGLELDLKGPEIHQVSQVPVEVRFQAKGHNSEQLTLEACEHQIQRSGAMLEVISSCSDNKKIKATLKATCLLKKTW